MTLPPIVVVGGSAGGIEPLQQFVSALPSDFPGAVFAVLHVAPYLPSHLPGILDRAGPLPAAHAVDGELVRAGRIYVAPPDRHLLIEDGRVSVTAGPKENRFRPSVDALFRSAAYAAGEDVIGVLLSGVLHDGTSGLWSIKRRGGTAIVQDPDEAEFDAMPLSAMTHVDVEYVERAASIGALVTRLVSERAQRPRLVNQMPDEEIDRLEREVQIAAGGHALKHDVTSLGAPSNFTCPDCQGVLYSWQEGSMMRLRCHSGHAFTPDALLAELTEIIEDKLYQALRSLEEGQMLLRHLGKHAAEQQQQDSASKFLARAQDVERSSQVLQQLIVGGALRGLAEVLPEAP